MPFLEAIVKYANYFKDNEQFLVTVLGWFFSTQGMRHCKKAIASPAVNHFTKLIHKYKVFNMDFFPANAQTIA